MCYSAWGERKNKSERIVPIGKGSYGVKYPKVADLEHLGERISIKALEILDKPGAFKNDK